MQLELSQNEGQFLLVQLRRHLRTMEDELAHTEKHELQHALAKDVDAMTALIDRLAKTSR